MPLSLKKILFLALLLLLPGTALAVQVGQPLIPFKGADLKGQPYDLQTAIGSKPVFLIFWASWCPSCKTEVPKVNQLAEKYRTRGMEFVAVNVGVNDTLEQAQTFARQTGMSYPAYFDGSGTLLDKYKLQGVPTVIIADKHGVIRFRNFAVPDVSEANFAQLMVD